MPEPAGRKVDTSSDERRRKELRDWDNQENERRQKSSPTSTDANRPAGRPPKEKNLAYGSRGGPLRNAPSRNGPPKGNFRQDSRGPNPRDRATDERRDPRFFKPQPRRMSEAPFEVPTPGWGPPTSSPGFASKNSPDISTTPVLPANSKDLVDGRLDLHADGFGFLIPKDPTLPNYYVGEESLRYVMHRDQIRIRVEAGRFPGAKARGVLVQILSRHQKEFLGVLRIFKGGALVIPTEARDRKHAFKIPNPNPKFMDLKSGTPVLARILTYPDVTQGTVEIVDIVQEPAAASNDTLRLLISAGWPREFSRAALSEAETRALEWKQNLGHTRRDIRHLNLVTIDGRDARDFDDAVCAVVENDKSIRLWVAIADVSLFVKPGSTLDRQAFERSTSVYFPDHVVPMLPEVLSNGVCSLNPFEERACLVCEAVVDHQGQIRSYEFYEGLMQSKRRLTYEQMQAYLEKEVWAKQDLELLTDNLDAVIEAFHRLLKAKKARGAIDLDIPEAQVMLKADGTVNDIQTRERLDAHRLIEECMLAANECAAKYLAQNFGAAMYRIHEEPDPKKVGELLNYVNLAGINLTQGRGAHKKNPSRIAKRGGGGGKSKSQNSSLDASTEAASAILSAPGDFADLIGRLKTDFEPGDPTARAIQSLVLRSLKQARYSAQPVGHFALAASDYTHFTSPIRRYPDMIVHRLIKEALRIESSPMSNPKELEQMARHCSDQERAAMDVERKLIDTKKCRYMESRLGEEFEAWVGGVTEKGVFCQIGGHYVEGLISADTIHSRIKHRFDHDTLTYVGPGKSKLQLGSRVKVRLAAVDIENRRIDFDLLQVHSTS